MCNLLKSQVLKTRTGTKRLHIPVYFTFFLFVMAFEKLTCLWDQKKQTPSVGIALSGEELQRKLRCDFSLQTLSQ